MSFFALPFIPAFNLLGTIAPAARLYFYATGTSTLAPVYADVGLTTPLANPVIASGAGRFVDIFLEDTITYRVRLETATGALIDEVDPYENAGSILGGPDHLARPGTVAAKLQQFPNPLDYPYLAKGDGVTDDRAALLALDAVGPMVITRRHYIATDLTLTYPPLIIGNGGFTGPGAATLTFPGSIAAPLNRRIFYGDLLIAGLNESHVEWFAGDIRTTHPTLPSANARPLIQKASNALLIGGTLRAGNGSWAIDGETIDLSNKSFEGAGYGVGQTTFWFSGTKRNGFHMTSGTALGGSVRDCSFNLLNASIPPTEGKVLYTTQSETVFENIETFGAYIGAHFNAMVIGRANNIRHNDCLINPLIIEDSLDVFYDKWNHSALGDLTTMTGLPTGGAFVGGEAVTCATGSSGIVQAAYTSTIYRIQWYGIRPPVGSTITATGKSATCASVVVSHQLGSVRFVSTTRLCEGNSILSGDSVGGELQLVAAGTGTIGRTVGNVGDIYIAPDALFDVSYGGSLIDSGYDWKVFGRYASTRNQDAPGLSLNQCAKMTGEPRCVNNAGAGIQFSGQHIYFKSNMDGNCRNYTLPDMAEIRPIAPARHWGFEGGSAGFPGLNGGVDPVRAIYVPAGAADFSVNIDCPVGSVTNLSTSNDQQWGGTPGMLGRSPVLTNYADDTAAATGGVPIGAHYRTGSVVKQRVA